MSLLLRTHYRLARNSIRRNRTRSFLTCLGIAIGVAAIIIILSLMGSVRHIVKEQVANAGEDLLVVRPMNTKANTDDIISGLTSSGQYLSSNLSLADSKVVSEVSGVKEVAPIAESALTLSAERKNDDGSTYTKTQESALVVGTTEALQSVAGLKMDMGSFISDGTAGVLKNKETAQLPTVVIGRDLSLSLLGTTEPIGKVVTMKGQKFMVTGLLTKTDAPINFYNIDFDNALIAEMETLEDVGVAQQVQQIDARVATVGDLPKVVEEVKAKLGEAKGGDSNFTVEYGNDISHPAGSLFNIVSSMLTLVAGVSLLVGGIGVMNIMLVSVAERTREIGIRKAVGASGTHILLQFLFESLILSIIGGVFGLALGYACAFLISVVTPFAPFVSVEILLVTLATSVSIGLIFGIYPAIKAARKNPIESLRYYR